MSQKLPSGEQQQEISWEEAVLRYLEDHPDFLQRHPEVLAKLHVTHHVGGRAVSLIERQVQVLREQNQTLQRQLRELVANARENDVLTGRLHRLSRALVAARSLDEVLDAALNLLREEFKIDAVRLLLPPGWPAPGRAEVVSAADTRLEVLLQKLGNGKPLCGAPHDAATLGYLFGGQAAEIQSSALIPVGEGAPYGILCLGSRDPHRFHAGQGTVYLSRFGELLAHGLARHRG